MKKKRGGWAATIYLYSVSLLLLVAALAKLFSAAGSARILDEHDPLLMLTNRQLMVGAAVLELVVVAWLILGRHAPIKYLLIMALNTAFAIYRLGVLWLTPGMPCPCLGTLTDRLPLEPATVDFLLDLVIAYLVLGSLYFLISDRLTQRGCRQESIEVPPG